MKYTFSSALTLLFFCCSVAQSAEPAATPAATPSSPLPDIQKALEGKWTLSVKFEPASGAPPNTVGTGEETWRAAVGGKTLVTEESWKAGPANISLLGLVWWDAKEQKLHAMDCNNQGKRVCDAEDAANAVVVKWDGSQLIIEEPERTPDNRLVTSRVTFTNITAKSFTEVDSIETSPGKFETMMTAQATRAGS